MTPNDNGQGHVHDNDRGGGNDTMTRIIVNTREKKVEGKEVTFDEIVRLAFETPPSGPNIETTVAYRKGRGNTQSGTMKPDDTVKVQDGTIFDVTATDKS